MPWQLPAPVLKKIQEGSGHPVEAALIVVHAFRAHLLASPIWHKYLMLHCQPTITAKQGLEHTHIPNTNAEPFLALDCNLAKVNGKELEIN